MKKILTFLVMLLCSMSILTAQTAFNYQAVVRDQNSHNLVKNTDLTVEVTITTLTTLGVDTVVYQAYIPTRTTLNGMASFLIADEYDNEAEVEFEVEPVGMAAFNWTDAIIKCVFMDGETEIATVETPVTAVPYALKADAGPITTEEIVRYIQDDLKKDDVKAIVDALVDNEEASDTIKDIIFEYAKEQKEMALDLALYFLGEVTPAYLHEAIDTLKQDTKDEIKAIIVDYLKNHKDMAVDVLAAYITQITKNDVEQLIDAAEQIPSTEKQAIAEYLIDFATDYIRNHHDLIQLAYTKLVDVVSAEDFENFYNYVKTTRNDIYQFMIARFDGYLVNYLNEHNYLQKCEDSQLDFCGLVAEVNTLQNSASGCPTSCTGTVSHNTDGTYTVGFSFNKALSGLATANELPLTVELYEYNDNMTSLLKEVSHVRTSNASQPNAFYTSDYQHFSVIVQLDPTQEWNNTVRVVIKLEDFNNCTGFNTEVTGY